MVSRKPCELSLLDHWNDIADVLVATGVTLKCNEAYKAFSIIGETARILAGHPEYDPKPEAEKLAAVAREHERMMAQARQKASAEATFALTDGGMPIDKNKIN